MSAIPGVPGSTYRLQLGPAFTFRDAASIVPYLHQLGISHVYASPFLKARAGSTHGYDITDHNALNPEVGSTEDFERFSDTLIAHGMGLILDFVPNHMGIGRADNEWWLDVLEWGQSSIYAEFFDIDWMPRQRHLQGKVLVPMLGDHYGTVLERGEIELRFDDGAGTFSAWYHEHRFPIRPRHYAIVIRRQLSRPEAAQRLGDSVRAELEHLAAEFDGLRRPGRRARMAARTRALALKTALAECCRSSPAAAHFIAAATTTFRGTPGDPRSFRALHSLLERQVYRLAFWRVAADEINYRRFFNINDLAGICMERPALFDLAHRFVGRLISEGRLQGIRLDHIDGLFDPRDYCRRLLELARSRLQTAGATGGAAFFYIVVEKILARHESLPDEWPIAGTTGYEFTSLVNGLFVDPAGQRPLERAYTEVAGRVPTFDDTLAAAKTFVIDNILASELNVLAGELDRISERHWATRDFTAERLRAALKEIVVNFPVYRTYVTSAGAAATDRRDIDWAVSRAKRGWRGPDPEILEFARSALTTDLVRCGGPYRRADVIRFAMKFQQYTGPVTAKSLEDTSFYRHHLLLSLNEVGGDPRQFAVSPAAFHHANRQRCLRWPHSLLTTATHDTKRGEDARMRIDVLTEMPDAWRRRVKRWARLNRMFRREVEGVPTPSRNDEYAIYQTLVGAWPAEPLSGAAPGREEIPHFAERMTAHVLKAVREAKLETSWDNPNQAYEDACTAFVRRLLDASRTSPFLTDFTEFHAVIAYLGMLNSCSQTVLKLTSPGVPDLYQGAELWDLSLVDPDNRREVDFELRKRMLKDLEASMDRRVTDRSIALRSLLESWTDGRIKLAILHDLFCLRREVPQLFAEGAYEPLNVGGARSNHVVAFLRRHNSERMIVVVGRFFAALLGATAPRYDGAAIWDDTVVLGPRDLDGEWVNFLTGETVVASCESAAMILPARLILSVLPVAVLVAPEHSKRVPADRRSQR